MLKRSKLWQLGSRALFLILLYSTFYILFATQTAALDMTSTNYQIIFTNLNAGGNRHTSTNYNLSSSLGQTFADRFTSSGYVAKVGFQYIYTMSIFSFQLSTSLINLGSLLPDTFASQSLTATVTNPSRGYDVQVIEDNPLRSLSLDTIADTICNGGAQTCTETSANVWTNTTAYGFGYNATGNDITSDFVNATYFRPFPDRSNGDTPVAFMTSTIAGTNRQATVTFQANVSGSQPAGTYQTVIDFIAVPKY